MLRRVQVFVVMTGAALVLRVAGQSVPRHDAQVYVPAGATLEPLAKADPGGNAVLRVRFDDRSTPPERVTYDTEHGPVVLADDGKGYDAKAGDGLYTALGTMDLIAARDRIERLAKSATAMPARAWRHRSKEDVQAVMDPRLWGTSTPIPWEMWGEPIGIRNGHSLLINDLGVVEDATRTRASCGQASMGVWSFGYLMEQMANTPVTGVTGPQFARAWVDRWMVAQSVNGWTVSARTRMQRKIIDQWIAVSGGPGMPLDLSRAPFRLLAIVNRLDLREQVAYGGGTGGELRFVFQSVEPGCTDIRAPSFQVIFEYAVPTTGCANLKALARQWKALGSLPLGSPRYNEALEAITQPIVVANAGGEAANGSTLSQLRTNENLLDAVGGLDWEAREFRIDPATHLLTQDTVRQTPGGMILFGPHLADYVNEHAEAIRAGDYVVPLRYPTPADSFRGGSIIYTASSLLDGRPGGARIVDREARHRFALNTCNGCHYHETATLFTHVKPAPFGTMSELSGFITGISVPDPADGSPSRYFNELQRRAVDMDALLSESCLVFSLDVPVRAGSH